MNIITDKDLLENSWPVMCFQKAYAGRQGNSIKNCVAITKEEGDVVDPNKTALIILRLFIESGEKAKKDQKYIAGLRFYGYGDMATIDVISLDKDFHRDMVHEHAVSMDWLLSDAANGDAFLESYNVPMVAVGAHLKVAPDNAVAFFGHSSDFSGNLFGWDVNEIAKQVAFICEAGKDGSKQGEEFLEGLLDFLRENKLREDFYEKIVERYIAGKFTGQNFGGLLTMKVLDRAMAEGKDVLPLLVEEATGGFAQKSLLIGVAQRLKKIQE